MCELGSTAAHGYMHGKHAVEPDHVEAMALYMARRHDAILAEHAAMPSEATMREAVLDAIELRFDSLLAARAIHVTWDGRIPSRLSPVASLGGIQNALAPASGISSEDWDNGDVLPKGAR